MILLDSQYSMHESGFGDAEYTTIFRSTYEMCCCHFHMAEILATFLKPLLVNVGYVPIALHVMFKFL